MEADQKGPLVGRREERRLERRSAILAVAAKSFLENGYDGTTMTAIATMLGGSKGTLWNHFASKEALFAAFLDEATSAFQRELMTVLERSRDLRRAIETFARRFIEKISTPETTQMYRLVVGESGRSPEVGRMFYDRAPGATEAILAHFLADQAKAGRLKCDDPTEAARVLLALCVGSGHQQMLCGGPMVDPAEISRKAVRIADLFLRLFASETAPASRPARAT